MHSIPNTPARLFQDLQALPKWVNLKFLEEILSTFSLQYVP